MKRQLFAISSSLLFAACATTGATSTGEHTTTIPVAGESHGKNVDLRVQGELAGEGGTIRVAVANHVDDAVGVDLDAIRLLDANGEEHEPLGRLQSFRSSTGEKTQRRVALGAITVPPAGHEGAELEFAQVPAGSLTLVIPKVYRLGIDGQEDLRSIRLPLHREKPVRSEHTVETASRDRDEAPGPDASMKREGKFFDPFSEW